MKLKFDKLLSFFLTTPRFKPRYDKLLSDFGCVRLALVHHVDASWLENHNEKNASEGTTARHRHGPAHGPADGGSHGGPRVQARGPGVITK